MNYDQPLQRKADGLWAFTSNGRPIGYCCPYPWDEAGIARYQKVIGQPPSPEYLEKQAQHRDKYHDGGHATEDEAIECYRQYLLDNSLRLQGPPPNPSTLHKCKVCDTFTAGYAQVGEWGSIWPLCDDHRNRETVETKLYTKGPSWSCHS